MERGELNWRMLEMFSWGRWFVLSAECDILLQNLGVIRNEGDSVERDMVRKMVVRVNLTNTYIPSRSTEDNKSFIAS